MAETVLKQYEENCKKCDKPTMEIVGKSKSFNHDSGEIFKTVVKCRICGRISYIFRPTQ